ncbi:MAG: TonB-dependent receptor, partial [Rhodospirillaceae bacterium]|nr:TonB-dependent receptor [Rhodospirillaceae bacterium]
MLSALVAVTAPAAHADNGKPKEYRLDDVVVTGTRQPAQLRNLSRNTAVIRDDDIDLVKPGHVAESLNRVSGMNIHRGNGQEHLTAIRSPVLTGGAGAGSFLYLQDGVPLRAAGFGNVNGLFEAHTEQAGSIEVVRGPGSALYGSNAVHGMINVLSRAPSKAR